MKQNVKILTGIAVVAALVASTWFFGDGSLFQGRASRRTSKAPVQSPVDFAITGESFMPSSSGKAYNYMTIYFKNTASVPTTADMSITIDGKEVAPTYAMDKVNNTTSYMSTDFLLSDLCKGKRVFAPQFKITIDKDNKIAESDETNNSMMVDATTNCSTEESMIRGEFVQGLSMKMAKLNGDDLSKFNKVIFSDVLSDSPYLNGVNYLYEKGVIKGIPDGKFGVDKYLNRAEAIKIMVVSLGLPVGDLNPPHPYADVSDAAMWFYPYIKGAVKTDPTNFGITDVKPYAGLKFRPEDAITNLEANVMINAIGK